MQNTYRILAVLFAVFAAVQYNDPDPLPWILLYGSVAVHFAMAIFQRTNRFAVWLTLIAAVVWAAALLPEFIGWMRMGAPTIVGSMKAEAPWIEYTREFLGLALAALACGYLLWTRKRT